MRLKLICIASLCFLVGCAVKHAQPKDTYSAQVLSAARNYQQLQLVSTQARLASELCRSVGPIEQISKADDASPHGKKLYLMWAKDATTYFERPHEPAATGQTLVKQSFEALEQTTSASEQIITRLTAGEPREFFVMMRIDRDAAKTDEGWIYGIVAPDLSRTIASGRIANCMQCHTRQPTRLFGMRSQP